MTVNGVIKLCVFLVTINCFIYHTNTAITSEEAKTLNFKMELMEQFVQNNSKTQQDEIKKLKNIVVEMNNTVEWMKKSIPICSDPEPINNGNVNYSATIMGSFATYVCDDNYTIQGQNERKCLSTRIWDGETPVCVPVSSCDLVITKDGHVIADGDVAFAVGDKENQIYCDAPCTGSGMPSAVQWFKFRRNGLKQRIPKIISKRVHAVLTNHSRISILTISNMLAKDAGKYTCRGWLITQGWVEKSIYLRYSCDRSSFMCDGTKCVNNDRHCDGVSDCRDATDETYCELCSENEFKCDGRCLSKSYMCDNFSDCKDGADEQNCPKTPTTTTSVTLTTPMSSTDYYDNDDNAKTPTTTTSVTDNYDYDDNAKTPTTTTSVTPTTSVTKTVPMSSTDNYDYDEYDNY